MGKYMMSQENVGSRSSLRKFHFPLFRKLKPIVTHHQRSISHCSCAVMPNQAMMSSLKTVAEAVIGLLTMLLQFMIHHLENVPEDPESQPEVLNTLEGMVHELQTQRSMLQSLMQDQSSARRQPRDSAGSSTKPAQPPSRHIPQSPPRINLASQPSTPIDSLAAQVNAQQVAQILQQARQQVPESFVPPPSMISSWALLDEEEIDADVVK